MPFVYFSDYVLYAPRAADSAAILIASAAFSDRRAHLFFDTLSFIFLRQLLRGF